MSTNRAVRPDSLKVVPKTAKPANISGVLQLCVCGPIPFAGTENAFYDGTWFLIGPSTRR